MKVIIIIYESIKIIDFTYHLVSSHLQHLLSEQDKKNLISNVVGAMKGITGPKKEEIINRLFRADIGLGINSTRISMDTNALTSFHGNGTKKAKTV